MALPLPSEDDINLQPWQSYQTILALKPSFEDSSESEQLTLLIRLAQAENLLYFYEDFDKTVDKFESFITPKTSAKLSSKSYLYAGMVAQRKGEYANAIVLFKKSMSQATDANLNRIFVYAKQELAYTRSLTELYETSLTGLQEAYLKAYAMDDQYLIGLIYETYGAIYGFMSEYEKSIEYHHKSLDVFKKLNYRAHIADATYGLATTYRYWGKYDLAISYFQDYQSLISYSPNADLSFYSAYGLGMTLAEKKDCQQALVYIKQALDMNGIHDYNAELNKRKASCLIQLKQLPLAEQALKEAESINASLPELKGTKWDLETVKIRGDLAFAKGEPELAYQLNNQYYRDYIDLLLKNSSARLVNVRAAMELERQNVEYVLLEQRNKVQALLVEQQQQKNLIQGYIIAIALFIIAVVFIALMVQWRNKNRILALSIRDSLSGLYNRRYIFEYLDNFLAKATPEKTELTVVMIDIDDFKQLNDVYGHPFGDQVIKVVAEISKETLRIEDIIGRIGGEEFLCVLPRLSVEQCDIIVNRIRENINQHVFTTDQNESVNITVSMGVASINEHCLDTVSLYAHVDKALYQAKNSGKNCVVHYQQQWSSFEL